MNFDDIIDLPHFHVPWKPYMSVHDRAGQFIPFKSLKGYDEMVGDVAAEAQNIEWANIDFSDDEGYDLDHFLDDDGDDEKFSEK